MLVEFECPQCRGHVCQRWGLDGSTPGIRLMYWHMVLNPALAINELLLGQRSPRNIFICKSCVLPLQDRSYLYCPSCGVFHSGRIWSYKNAFRNWLGLACPSCGAAIPCLWNFTSLVILFFSAPLWWLPVRQNRQKWLLSRRDEILGGGTAYLDVKDQKPKPIDYKRMGIMYGGGMFVCFSLLFPLMYLGAAGHFNAHTFWPMFIMIALMGLVIWPLAGFLFAVSMRWIMERKGDPAVHLTFDEKQSAQLEDQQKKSDESTGQ